jgi:hypothetical protein
VILDAHEWQLIAEVRASRDRDLWLALAPGSYHIKRVLQDRIEVASITIGMGPPTDIDRAAYQSVPLSSGILKGEPSDLSSFEHHQWAREQAFGVLATGDATASLNAFDALLRESPGDMLAWRGRARALVRMAESYRRVGDSPGEERALREALKSDPSLSYDTEFQTRYQEFLTRHAAEEQRKMEILASPRSIRRFGWGFELLSARGLAGVSGTVVIADRLFPRVAIDLLGTGLDTSVSVALLRSRWTPYLALGGHVSVQWLGLYGSRTAPTTSSDPGEPDSTPWYDLHARLEVGAQFVGVAGAITEFGLAVILYEDGAKRPNVTVWPVFHVGGLL